MDTGTTVTPIGTFFGWLLIRIVLGMIPGIIEDKAYIWYSYTILFPLHGIMCMIHDECIGSAMTLGPGTPRLSNISPGVHLSRGSTVLPMKLCREHPFLGGHSRGETSLDVLKCCSNVRYMPCPWKFNYWEQSDYQFLMIFFIIDYNFAMLVAFRRRPCWKSWQISAPMPRRRGCGLVPFWFYNCSIQHSICNHKILRWPETNLL